MKYILGHERTMQKFIQGIHAGKLHHAWLLYGPGGIGKASLAWSMACTYLCKVNHPGGAVQEACGRCHSCSMMEKMKENAHPDYLYVERGWDKQKKKRKRDISVDQVREILSFLSLSGAESDKRVVLLDEASLLNQHASNALIKGLEEPAAGSLLLLVCDDVMRLPATVRSRCMLERLLPLDEEQCSQALRQMGLQDEALRLGIELGAGRPGSVSCLGSRKVAEALLQWRQLTRVLADSDIGAIQEWLVAYVALIPHPLIVRTALLPVYGYMQQPSSFAGHEALMNAVWCVAAWPERVARHSLRAWPTLLAHMLSLRIALRSLRNAA